MNTKPLAISLSVLAGCAFAATPASVSFSHGDWELACDNTRTCRAAGYQPEMQNGRPVSMLLTRQAGPNSLVTAHIRLGEYDEPTAQEKKAARKPLVLRINGKPVQGALVSHKNMFTLTQSQAQAVLAALTRSSRIEVGRGGLTWHLSDQGAAAVLLKMDEFQGRLHTQGALVSKGARSESQVLPPLPAPVVLRAPLARAQALDAQFAARHAQALQRAVEGRQGEEVCPLWREEEAARFDLVRLTADKLLLSSLCWRAAYNEGVAYWVIQDRPPFQPERITDSGTDFSNGTVAATQKGRGLGDCWAHQAWTWDGQRFVKTAEGTTGMCRLIAAGGAWDLPTLVTEVKPQGQ